jgi:hypothetical protein
MCDGADWQQQAQLQEERQQDLMEILERVRAGTTTQEDASILAAELGIVA